MVGNYTPCLLLGGLVMGPAWRRTEYKHLRRRIQKDLYRERTQMAREEASKHDITFNWRHDDEPKIWEQAKLAFSSVVC